MAMGEDKADRRDRDKALDKSLEDTFPASDPVAALQSLIVALQPLTAVPTVLTQRTRFRGEYALIALGLHEPPRQQQFRRFAR